VRWIRPVPLAMIATTVLAAVFAAAANGVASANDCATRVQLVGGGGSKTAHNATEKLTLIHGSKWSTDSWDEHPPDVIRKLGQWRSKSGYLRGCHIDAKYRVECTGFCWAPLSNEGTVDFSLTVPYRGSESSDCTVTRHDTRPFYLNGHCHKQGVVEPNAGNVYVIWSLSLCTSYINIPEPGVPPPPPNFRPGIEICLP
jgi:hypothetical protein